MVSLFYIKLIVLNVNIILSCLCVLSVFFEPFLCRTLKQCAQTTSKEKTLSTWQASNLEWTDLGLQEKDIEEFLHREVILTKDDVKK